MVDWDRVEQLHKKGQSWEEIASDPKVGFHPDQSVTQAGPALRRLYYRRRSRAERQPEEGTPAPKRFNPQADKRWSLARIGYLLVPIIGIWFVFAFVFPSPLGLILAAIPYIAIILAVVIFVLAFGLLRTNYRWTKVFRSTVILGVVLGLVFAGLISLTAVLIGCPFLPSSSALTTEPGGNGWAATPSYVSAWTASGVPVMYFYGATWCPYCSASSWAMWKALTEFDTGFGGSTTGISGTSFQYSNPDDVDPSTPEVVLAFATITSSTLSFQVSEYYWTLTSGVAGTFPATSNCVQAAYVAAYSGSSIPFLVLNGQYVHGGSTLIDPGDLSDWADGSNGGYNTVATDVLHESGTPWSVVETQAGWICAFLIRANGYSTVGAFLTANPSLSNPSNYQWTSTMTSLVNGDLAQIT